MATLNIIEFKKLGRDENGNIIPVAEVPYIAEQNVTYTTTTQSAAFQGSTKFVRLVADADAYVKFDASPTATVTSMRLASGHPEYFSLHNVESIKVAAYDGSS